jgi:hypothetical protein
LPTLPQIIAEKFLTKLAEGKDVDAEKIGQLRNLLANGKRAKSEDFLKIFTAPADGDVK